MTQDVPSRTDLRLAQDALEWEHFAMRTRPWRAELFARFACEVAEVSPNVERVLELGSGSGFLAKHLLQSLSDVELVLLDFSSAMHELARETLNKPRQ